MGLVWLVITCAAPAAAADDTIKIGILHSLSGTMAAQETALKDVLLFLVDEQNKKGGVLGKKLVAVVADPASNWPLFAEKARELIVKDKVSVVFGCWTPVSRMTVLPIFKELNSILFYPIQNEGGRGENNVFYTGGTPDQQAIPAMDYLMDHEKVQRWILAGTDYSYSRAINKLLEDRLKSRGVRAEDILTNYTPFGFANWQTFGADFKKFGVVGKKAAIISTLSGNANISFYKELNNQNIQPSDTPVVALSFDEEELASIGGTVLRGQLAALNYLQSIKTPANQEFTKKWQDYTKNPNRIVTDPMEAHYIGFNMWIKAVEKAKSIEPEKIIPVMTGIEVPNLTGGVSRMLEDHHITRPTFIAEVGSSGRYEAVWSTSVKKEVSAAPTSAPTSFSSSSGRPSFVNPSPSPQLPQRPGRASTEQTTPGQGGEGTTPAPAANQTSANSPAILPAPSLAEAADTSAGSSRKCMPPPSTAIPSTDQFFKSSTPIPYCQDGFKDVLLLDTADLSKLPQQRICSGVRIAESWVLTAKHCVERWTENSGRIFALLDGSPACLDRRQSPSKHPGDECSLPILGRQGMPTAAPSASGREVDLALIRVGRQAGQPLPPIASIRKMTLTAPAEITLAGFGAAPNGDPAGKLRVGWSRISDPAAVGLLFTDDSQTTLPLSVRIVFTTSSYGKNSPGSWACGGDSGAPLFAGRIFGYKGEPHVVTSIVSESSLFDPNRCKKEAVAEDDSTAVVSLMHPAVSKWLCSVTEQSLDICK
jgi:urea transport system substrate-binding protein